MKMLDSPYMKRSHVEIRILKFPSGNLSYELHVAFKGCYTSYATLETITDVRLQRKKMKLIGWHKSDSEGVPGMSILNLFYQPKKIRF